MVLFFKTEVAEIRSFLDEDYSVPISGRGNMSANFNVKLPWARIGIEKFVDRIIPHLANSNEKAEASITPIMTAVKNAVSFGNGTIIIDKNGAVRASVPENSEAKIDVFGNITYEEKFVNKKNETMTIVGQNGDLYLEVVENDQIKWFPIGAKYFSIFYNADGNAQHGRSRISPAIRGSIRAASRNRNRLEEIAQNHAIPKRLFNGIWEGLDPSIVDGIGKITSGASDVLGLPTHPVTGEKISIDEFSAADIQPFLDIHLNLAKDVATAFNVDPSEFGATTPQNISSDALYASKEDLILEIAAFERSIKPTLQNALDFLCEKTNQQRVELSWQEPATPSKASQADAFVKLAGVVPGLSSSRKALAWAGLSNDVIDDLIQSSALPSVNEAVPRIESGDTDENKLF